MDRGDGEKIRVFVPQESRERGDATVSAESHGILAGTDMRPLQAHYPIRKDYHRALF